ncbi:MAG: 2-oxoglutarate dehydrogenase complex dihydrolipoyllysine-residue succinyltransferase, partial [Flammeovirgaceae bacterium]|nr:2-oxoglutarate dehydrogenase complex dihydrolipoyllysine-residue succinyltransferase [Flammeovirgaceae bacterium]MDW8288368.1 2-oxoglutarate dehydrogenase complex dihydrolipoyllysine-residue succinyltransferase [Flammeovirgaceae bacterium]
MNIAVKVPPVGESITEVTVANWNKKDGDFVRKNDVLCDLESEKATFELNAEQSGILKINVPAGKTVPIGTVICEIMPSEEVSAPVEDKKSASKTQEVALIKGVPTGRVVEMKVPSVGESISEVTLSSWVKKDGDFVKKNEALCELESEKATFELTADVDGILRIVAKAGTTLPIGSLVCKIEEMTGSATAASTTTPTSSKTTEKSTAYASGHASPAATKILAEKGIETSQVKGTGVEGRITKEDALKAQKIETKTTVSTPTTSVSANGLSNRIEKRERMTTLRRTIARRLVAVKNETAMLTTFNEVDMKAIMDLRAKYKDTFKEKHGVGLGFMSFFVKACCMALKDFPIINASVEQDDIVYRDFVDVSIAVSTDKGLVVPIIRNAEKMSLHEIEAEIVRLATKAREGKLTIPEMTGGTFTITNGGVFGSMLSTPIINAPQSAILGMHNIVERPVAINGQVVIRPIMYVALSYDHRII